MNFDKKNHWEGVYTNKKPVDVSWYQSEAAISLDLIASTGIGRADKIIDVGGGASILVDKLIEQEFKDLTVLDISSKALHYAKNRLGQQAEDIAWIEADVTEYDSPVKYDLWHDRAVFHFLTDPEDRKKYVKVMSESLNSGGHIIISSFAIDGPLKCSGLDVERYSSEKIKNELGDSFELLKSMDEIHMTPFNKEQKFTYFYFQKNGS